MRAGSAHPACRPFCAGTPATVELRRHRMQHNRTGGDARALANLDIAEDLGSGADQHALADLRDGGRRPPCRCRPGHVLQHRNVVLDDRGRADDEAGRVIEENAFADPRRRMDIGLEYLGRAALEIEREILRPAPERMRQPMRLDRMEALEIEHRLDQPRGRPDRGRSRPMSARKASAIAGSLRSRRDRPAR